MLRELHPGMPTAAVDLDDTLEASLGFDSLSRLELVSRIERNFGLQLSEERVTAARTPRDLLAAIAAAQGFPTLAQDAPVPLPEAVSGTPDRAATLLEAYRWHLERHPEREMVRLVDGHRTLETTTYGSLWAAAAEVANGLEAAGVRRADTVALMLPTSIAFFEVFLGALLLGAVPVPMYPPTRWSEIAAHVASRAAILANARARLLVTVPEALFVGTIIRAEQPWLRDVVSPARLRQDMGTRAIREADVHDVALLQYTSGSTGEPKGVMLTHGRLLANIRAMGSAAAATSSDRFVSWLPLYHDMGLIGAWLGTLYHAVPLVLMAPTTFLAHPATWLQAISRHRATISAGPNFAYEIAASKIRDEELAGVDLRTWRLAFNGAEPVRAATLKRFASRFARYGFNRRALTPVYGLAESAVGLAFPPLGRGPLVDRIDAGLLMREGRAAPATAATPTVLEVVACGLPLPGHELRVVDAGAREVPARVEGRVEFRGPSATEGYYRNPDATDRLIRDGWLDTGDIGYIADGELYLTSRAKDLIKRGGHTVHPYDLEAAIGELPGVRKGCIAVFGTTDRARGTERVIVVAETNRTGRPARQALREQLAQLATLHLDGPADEILVVDPHTLLKTSSGKIRRAACRELYERGLLPAPRRAVWLQLVGLVARAAMNRLRQGLRAGARIGYATWAWAMVLLVTAATLPLLLAVPDAGLRRRVAQGAAAVLLWTCRVPLTVEGREHLADGRPALIVANHASYVDAFVLAGALGGELCFAAKREFARTPLVAWALRRLGTHFVDRVDAAGGIEDTRELAAAVQRGERIVVFPEGTFSRIPGLAPFHLGAFVASATTGAAVIPVVLRGSRSVLRDTQWLPAHHPVAVIVLPAMTPDGADWAAAVRLRDTVRAAMLLRCGEPDLMS